MNSLSRLSLAALSSLLCAICVADEPCLFNVPRVPSPGADISAYGMPVKRLMGLDVRSARLARNAGFYLAWDASDLIILADVEDTTPYESEGVDSLHRGDSIDLCIAPADRPEYRFQIIIAPGNGAEKPVRMKVGDHRGEGAPALSCKAERLSRENGYRLLVRIPFASLGIAPESGKRLRMQFAINDSKEKGRSQAFAWYPSPDSWRDAQATYVLRLANKTDDRSEVATLTTPRGFRETVTLVRAPRSAAGERARLSENGKKLAEERLTTDGDASIARLRLPMQKSKAARRLTLEIDGDEVASVVIPESPDPRVAVEQMKFQTERIFWTSQFPTCDFAEPLDAEDLLGPYQIATTYYDADLNPVTEAPKPGRYAAVSRITSASGETFTRYTGLYRAPARPDVMDWWSDGLKMQVELPEGLGVDPSVARRESRVIGEQFTQALRSTLSSDAGWASLFAGLSEMSLDAPESVGRTGPSAVTGDYFCRLRMKIEGFRYPYAVSLPKGCSVGDTQKRPLILFLHGSGERGSDLKRVEANHVVKQVRKDDLPFIVISPQCPQQQWWEPLALDSLLNEVVQKYPVDVDRIYVTGLSMGGFGTWNVAQRYPDRFTAIAPICGVGDHLDMAQIKDLPTWVFHGDQDESVPLAPDARSVDALKQVRGRVRFTVYPGVGHDSWTRTYANPELYAWFLEQKRGQPKEPATQPAGLSSAAIDR